MTPSRALLSTFLGLLALALSMSELAAQTQTAPVPDQQQGAAPSAAAPTTAAPPAPATAPAAAPAPTAVPAPAATGEQAPAAAAGGQSGQTAVQPPPAAAPAPPAPPPAELPDDLKKPIADVLKTMDQLEKSVAEETISEEQLSRYRKTVDEATSAAAKIADSLKPKLAEIETQIEALGKPPEAGQPAEAKEVAGERARLDALKTSFGGGIKTMEVVGVRAESVKQRIQEVRQDLFTSQLLRRSPSPLLPTIWLQVAREIPSTAANVTRIVETWWGLAKQQPIMVLSLFGAVLAVFLILKSFVYFLIRTMLPPDGPQPSYFERAGAAGWVAPALALPAGAASLLLVFGLDSLNLLTYQVGRVADTALPAVLIFIAVSALARAVLAPKRSRWRLLNLADKSARKIATTASWLAGVYAIDQVLKELINILYLPLSVSVAVAAVSSIAMAFLLIRLVHINFLPPKTRPQADARGEGSAPPVTPGPGPEATTPGRNDLTGPQPLVSRRDRIVRYLRPMILKVPLLAVAVAIMIASLAGYVAFGRFLAGQMVVTVSVIVLVLLLHLAIKAVIGEPGQEGDRFKSVLDERFGLGDTQRHMLGRGATILLNALLAIFAVPLILLSWGFSQEDAFEWVRNVIFGFRVGSFQISLAQILIAIGLFVALLVGTRLVQRWLSARMSKPPRVVDQGIQDSIHTFVGYVGIGIAVLAAMSYAGLDFTNFAIVAGALSVGVGLGLQAIVNNFVSGLIILLERPIKVGDRVVVRGQEGHVRRISVRSTEIETFDRASLIVPNSELVTHEVINKTHRNTLGRALVKVGASYDADPEQVLAILHKVAAESPLVMKFPEPFIFFDDFGPSSLDFVMACAVPDVADHIHAQTDLRIRIMKEFRAAGIEIPYSKHDVYLRDLDGVKSTVMALMRERARRQQEGGGNTGGSGGGGDKPGGDGTPPSVPFPPRRG